MGYGVKPSLLLAAIAVVVVAVAANYFLWIEGGGKAAMARQDAIRAETFTPTIPPSFDVTRIVPKGNTVITGKAEPGSIVAILDGGREIASVIANQRGEWTFTPTSPLLPGMTRLSLEMRIEGMDVVASSDAVVLVVPEEDKDIADRQTENPSQALALKVPKSGAGASTVLQKPTPSKMEAPLPLSVDTVDYDASGTLFISGHGAVNGVLQIYLDNTPIGHAMAGEKGAWIISPESAVTPGVYTLRVDQVDASGKVLARVEIPFSRAEPPKEGQNANTFVVQPGNNLWMIARGSYGEGPRFTVIYEANKKQIKDPNLIYPGQVFTLPPPQ